MADEAQRRSDPDQLQRRVEEWTPRPDPTLLTTQQLLREISALTEQFNLKITGLDNTLSARLNAIDKATDKFEATLTSVPTDVDRQVGQLRIEVGLLVEGLKQYHGERFTGVDDQFSELRAAIEKSERVTKVAVDAALEAAGKANAAQAETFLVSSNKTETNFTKQIDQLAVLIQANTKALDDKIIDAKERITRIEAAGIGATTSQRDTHSASTLIVAIVAVLLSALSAAAAWIHVAAK